VINRSTRVYKYEDNEDNEEDEDEGGLKLKRPHCENVLANALS
jgi:hypothetical protein